MAGGLAAVMPGRGRVRVRVAAAVVAAVLAGAAAAGLSVMIAMPGRNPSAGALPPLTPEQRELRTRLERHIRALAGEIGERNLWRHDALEAASRYVQASLREPGLEVELQAFEVDGRPVENVVATRPGAARPHEILVVGAHYDSVLGCPGANDNATGVAALLELARMLAQVETPRTIRFAAFVNEEPPFFQTAHMGSLRYARRARERDEQVVAMLSIETIGAYSDAPGSQRYPLPFFGLFYPGEANFIAFVANVGSRALVRRAIRTFREHAAFPAEGSAAPGWVPGVGWSDHWAFWQHGYRAFMVTDTALYRYPHYHTADDTPDKIDYDRLTRVVSGLRPVIVDLAQGEMGTLIFAANH